MREDGNGRVLIEDNGLVTMAQNVRDVLKRKKTAVVARIALAWCVIRETIEDKAEALFGETQEVLVYFAPQVVALILGARGIAVCRLSRFWLNASLAIAAGA